MPLKSKREYGKGILINQINDNNKNNNEIPFNIYVYQMPEIIVKSNTTMGEYYTRQQLKGLLNPFNADYYVDKISSWCILPICNKIINVGICGHNEKVYNNVIKLLIYIAKKYDIGLNQIFFKFENQKLIENFKEEAYNNKIKEINFEIEEPKLYIVPRCQREVMINGIWQEPDLEHLISGLKISTNIGVLKYRLHYYQGTWSSWGGNGEPLFSQKNYVDGLQYDFFSDDYWLEFSATIEGRGKLPWKRQTLQIPYNKIIKSFDFRLIEKELN